MAAKKSKRKTKAADKDQMFVLAIVAIIAILAYFILAQPTVFGF